MSPIEQLKDALAAEFPDVEIVVRKADDPNGMQFLNVYRSLRVRRERPCAVIPLVVDQCCGVHAICNRNDLSECLNLFRFHGKMFGESVERFLLNTLHFSLFDSSNRLCRKIRLEVLSPKSTLLAKTAK